MFDDLLQRAAALEADGQPFVLATVVACKAPTSAKPGAKAIVRPDGGFHGWVGGSCAQPIVTREALEALDDGQPRLVLLAPDPADVDVGLEGAVLVPMTCRSEGTLAVYLEPRLPRPELVVIGQSPVARSLVAQGGGLGFRVRACDPSATHDLFPGADALVPGLDGLAETLGSRAHVVIATMGHYDEEALEEVLRDDAAYVGLVASPRRGRAVIDYLRSRDVPSDALSRVKYPAGLDIGAKTPEEVALSILTEIVQRMRACVEEVAPPPLSPAADSRAVDPVCGMTVDVASSRHSLAHVGAVVHFCCPGCMEKFRQSPDDYPLAVV